MSVLLPLAPGLATRVGVAPGPVKILPPSREPDFIEIVGAREHNLDVDRLEVPKRRLVVFTGVSGSGKSSLAFDTLYAEGQRRYVETLSSYARQFLGQLDRPHVEHLRGLSPTIAIEQKSASGNPRSTVGTITEIYDYLRVLYARAGEQHCHVCGERVAAQSPEQIVERAAHPARGHQADPGRARWWCTARASSASCSRSSRSAASPACRWTASSTSSTSCPSSTRSRSTSSIWSSTASPSTPRTAGASPRASSSPSPRARARCAPSRRRGRRSPSAPCACTAG